MADARSVVAEAWEAGLEPEPELTISEWADRYRILAGKAASEPGPWRTDRTPYLREIMDQLSPSSDVETVVFMKGSQVGATECGNNFLGFVIHHAPGPMLYVQPTLTTIKRTSKQRIAPMIDSCPVLRERVQDARSRDSGNTIFEKEFLGGILILSGANSAASLRSVPVRYLFLDEVDGYEVDIDGEGDPIALAKRRTATYELTRKIFICSTPTTSELSKIEKAFEQTDKRYYNVPCPHCGFCQPIRWAQIRWPKGEPRKAVLVCESCQKDIPERHKGRMLANGRWVPTAEGEPGMVGYHLSALYSPLGWYSWGQAASDFLKAKREGPAALKSWINTVLGESWDEGGESVDADPLFNRREKYAAEVPQGALLLTAGVDIQDDRIELEVVGWGPGEESWGVDYRVLYGDPDKQELWDQLEDALGATYKHESGEAYRIVSACIDSGGHHTQKVYTFCKHRQVRRIFAIKGDEGEGRPIVSSPRQKRTGRNRRPVRLFVVGVDGAKSLLYSRLRLTDAGPGFCHFPISDTYDQEYFAQLTAEKMVTRYVRGFSRRAWVKTRPRNEALDCRVYAMAALYILNPNWKALDRRAKESETQSDEPRKVTRKRNQRGRRSSWVHGW